MVQGMCRAKRLMHRAVDAPPLLGSTWYLSEAIYVCSVYVVTEKRVVCTPPPLRVGAWPRTRGRGRGLTYDAQLTTTVI